MIGAGGDDGVVAAVRERLGELLPGPVHEASVTFLGAPPIRVLRSADAADPSGVVTYATCGCSAEPMGDPTALVRADGPRAELLVRLRGGVDAVVRPLAVLAASPVIEGLVLAPGAILDTGEPLWEGSAFTAFVITAAEPAELTVTPSGGEPVEVQLLCAIPVTPTEAAWARVGGVPELLAAWDEAGVDVEDPGRPAAAPQTPPRRD